MIVFSVSLYASDSQYGGRNLAQWCTDDDRRRRHCFLRLVKPKMLDQPTSYKKVQTAGVKGKKTVTYEITMQNGKGAVKVIQSVTTVEPQEQVEVVGAKPSFSGDFAAALAKLRACESG